MVDTNYKLRAWMGANRVSYAEMARRMDMPYDTFKWKIYDKSEWKLSEILRIKAITGCTFEELF